MAKIYKPGQLLTFKVKGTKYIIRIKKREQVNNACPFCCFTHMSVPIKEYYLNKQKCNASPMACTYSTSYYYELVKTINQA